jgi:outer membrane protein TolC
MTMALLGCGMMGSSPAYGITVDLDSCRQMALHNNKLIRIADRQIESAGYLNKAAKAAYLPGFDFNMGYAYNQHQIALLGEDSMLPTMSFDAATGTYQYNIVKNPTTGEPVVNPSTGTYIPTEVAVIPKEALTYDVRNVFAGALTLTQPVYMGGAIRAMNEITRYAGELAKSMRNTAAQDVIFAVDEAYWQVVSLKEKKRLADSFVCLVDTFLYNVNAMYKEGVATKSDILTVQVKSNEAAIAQTKVNNGLSLSRMALAQICGLPVDSELQLSDEALRDEPKDMPPLTYNMEDVYAARQDLLSLRHGISIYEQKEKLALSEMLPKVALVGAYTFSNPNTINGFKKEWGGGFSVGATLTVPLWHWGGNYNKYKAAKVETSAQRLLLDEAQEKVNLQVSQARYKYEEAYKTYRMTVTNQEKADENLRQAELGFKEGVLTTDDVIAAQTAWLQAHSESIDAEISIRLCDVYLSKVLGKMNY